MRKHRQSPDYNQRTLFGVRFSVHGDTKRPAKAFYMCHVEAGLIDLTWGCHYQGDPTVAHGYPTSNPRTKFRIATLVI